MWKANYRREKRSKFFGPSLPFGSLVVPQQSNGTGTANLAAIPPFTYSGRNFVGHSVIGLPFNNSRTATAPQIFHGAAGAVPTTPVVAIADSISDPGAGVWGLQRPIVRHAVQHGHVWAPAVGNFGGANNRHLIRLSNTTGALLRYSSTAAGTAALATPAFAIGWNKVIYAQEALNSVVSWTIGSDGTATFDGDITMPFGVSPDGVGAAVLAPSGTKALVIGKNFENRHQICQTTDGSTYTALPAQAISAGSPLRVLDAIACPAIGATPAAIVISCILGSTSGTPRILRSTDDGVNFTLLAIDSVSLSESGGALHLVNGMLFLLFGNAWYYSTNNGATFTKGSASISPQRIQWDADLECYIFHSSGAVVIVENDLSIKGTVPLPVGEALTTTLAAANRSNPVIMSGINPSSYPTASGLLYEDTHFIGIAVCSGTGTHFGQIAYRYDLNIMRLPKLEAAEVILAGGGAAGDIKYQASLALVLFPLTGSTNGAARTPANPTSLLGIGTASGGDNNFSDMNKTVPQIVDFRDLSATGLAATEVKAKGAAGIELDGKLVSGGGDRIIYLHANHPIFQPTGVLIFGQISGGDSGEIWRGIAEGGSLLVFIVGTGGKLFYDIPSQATKAMLSVGQDGGALVEYWENVK
jgi:hypothetical protein